LSTSENLGSKLNRDFPKLTSLSFSLRPSVLRRVMYTIVDRYYMTGKERLGASPCIFRHWIPINPQLSLLYIISHFLASAKWLEIIPIVLFFHVFSRLACTLCNYINIWNVSFFVDVQLKVEKAGTYYMECNKNCTFYTIPLFQK
jgi:hypothetical protein